MGKPVTVDSDDLEKIIMLTGVHKQIENLLRQHKGDPFVPTSESAVKDAHDRLAAEWRRATREYHPDCDMPLSPKSYTLLKELDGKIAHLDPAMMKNPLYQELFKKLHIEYGNYHEVIYWSNSQEQQKVNPHPAIMVRVTMRGKELLLDMATKDQSRLN